MRRLGGEIQGKPVDRVDGVPVPRGLGAFLGQARPFHRGPFRTQDADGDPHEVVLCGAQVLGPSEVCQDELEEGQRAITFGNVDSCCFLVAIVPAPESEDPEVCCLDHEDGQLSRHQALSELLSSLVTAES